MNFSLNRFVLDPIVIIIAFFPFPIHRAEQSPWTLLWYFPFREKEEAERTRKKKKSNPELFVGVRGKEKKNALLVFLQPLALTQWNWKKVFSLSVPPKHSQDFPHAKYDSRVVCSCCEITKLKKNSFLPQFASTMAVAESLRHQTRTQARQKRECYDDIKESTEETFCYFYP